jgi:hypothetical protein
MAMKLWNRIKRIGHVASLKEALKLNEDDCDLRKVYVQIIPEAKKIEYSYRFLVKTYNIHRTGFGNNNEISIFSDSGFRSIDIALAEVTEQIIDCKDKYPEMDTVFCYFYSYPIFKKFNYSLRVWEPIDWEDFVEKYGN